MSEKKSKFWKSLTEKQTSVLFDYKDTEKELLDVLVENGYINAQLINELNKIDSVMKSFEYDTEAIGTLIKYLGVFSGYKVYLHSQFLNKITLKNYFDNVEANTWIYTKGEIKDWDKSKLKTDSFVNNETTIKLNNLRLLQGFLFDFNKKIDIVIDSLEALISFINVKIKFLREEREMIKQIKIRDPDWHHAALDVIQDHKFYTSTQIQERNQKLQENVKELKKQLGEI